MPKLSGREIDYTQTDMLKLTGLERIDFLRTLKRICDMYNIDISDFKVEKDNINSEFFFIPEVAEYLAILMRTFTHHPLYRKNAKTDEIQASTINEYYKIIMEDIDKNANQAIADTIYSLEGHLATQKITDWAEPFTEQLTRFLLNISTLPNQDLGSALKWLTMKLDSINYNLFRGSYTLDKGIDANIEELYRSKQIKSYNKRLIQKNISIDHLVAEILLWYKPKMLEIRKSNFKEYKFIDCDEMRNIFDCDPNELPIDEKRNIYFALEVGSSISNVMIQNDYNIHEKERNESDVWKDISELIAEGTFQEPKEKILEEQIQELEKKILEGKNELEQNKQLLSELKLQKQELEKNELLQEIKTSFLKHSQQQDAKNKEVSKVVDKFVGQVIYELLK